MFSFVVVFLICCFVYWFAKLGNLFSRLNILIFFNSGLFFSNLLRYMHDMGSTRSFWSYFFLELFGLWWEIVKKWFWIIVFLLLHFFFFSNLHVLLCFDLPKPIRFKRQIQIKSHKHNVCMTLFLNLVFLQYFWGINLFCIQISVCDSSDFNFLL